VIALYAFDHELARATLRTSNPTLAQIRLTWWAEGLAAGAAADPGFAHAPSSLELESDAVWAAALSDLSGGE
jgi:phytoene/squalene synthetase